MTAGPDRAGEDRTRGVMARLGYAAAPRQSPGRDLAWAAARAVAVLSVAGAALAWWGMRSREDRQSPAVAEALRGSVTSSAVRLEGILLGMPRPSSTSPALSADASPLPGAAAGADAAPGRTY